MGRLLEDFCVLFSLAKNYLHCPCARSTHSSSIRVSFLTLFPVLLVQCFDPECTHSAITLNHAQVKIFFPVLFFNASIVISTSRHKKKNLFQTLAVNFTSIHRGKTQRTETLLHTFLVDISCVRSSRPHTVFMCYILAAARTLNPLIPRTVSRAVGLDRRQLLQKKKVSYSIRITIIYYHRLPITFVADVFSFTRNLMIRHCSPTARELLNRVVTYQRVSQLGIIMH